MRKLILSNAIVLSVVMSSATYADISGSLEIQIEFNDSGETGADLDNVDSSDLPFTTPVVEDTRTGDDQLTISVIGLTGTGDFFLDRGTAAILNFGINSSGQDNAFDFDANFGESVTFAFNQDVYITEIDLDRTLFGGLGDVFEVGGVTINDSDTPASDIFSFIDADNPHGLFVAAGDGVLLQATGGSVQLASLTVQIASALTGDFDGDGDVDADDIDFYSGNLDLPAADDLAQLDLTGDGFVTIADHDLHVTTLVQTSNGVVGTAIGDINLDGQVDVLGDAFILVDNLGSNDTSWETGDLNADQTTNVLGDAFRLVNNLGASNDAAAAAAP